MSVVRLLLVCVAALAVPLAGASAERPRLTSAKAAYVGESWTGVLTAAKPPVVVARLGSSRQRVAVRRLARGRYALRARFRAAGTWVLIADGRRVGRVVVRWRLTNALDVVVEPGGTLLVADFSNRVFRQDGARLTMVAGNGRGGRTGDGGAAIRAAIGFPVEVAVDPRGGFGLVHDERWIRHVDPGGTIRTVAEFRQPTALAYDAAGNLYVSELLGGVVRRNAVTGATTTYDGFNRPHGLAVASDGAVYVADTFANRVAQIAPNGAVTTFAGGLDQPNDVALGPDGDVYATVYGSNAIVRIAAGGAVTTVARAAGPSSVAVGPDGTVYFTERNRGAVRTGP